MCGIAGILALDNGSVDRVSLERMVSALGHRGPDGRGSHVDGPIGLGHTRLSILDPTSAGAQPMRRGDAVIVHNGEVYNYLELAEELRGLGERIMTGTDTEVILACYTRWGLRAIDRLNGMFAFALWDATLRRLVLARDRMGVKPLYVRRTAHSLAFASEPTALLASRPIDPSDRIAPEPNVRSVRDFLVRGATDHSTETFFGGITCIAPGHALVLEAGQERSIRYWDTPDLSDDARSDVPPGDRKRDLLLVEEFSQLFDSAVRLRLRSDVPIGTCLSGGLDSSSIVATIARALPAPASGHEQLPRLAFHARYPDEGIDESGFADLVAAACGIRMVYRSPGGRPLLANMIRELGVQGEPYGGASINAQHGVMAAVHEHGLKVLLDGQGADELLGGYIQYLGIRAAGLALSRDLLASVREIRAQVRLRTTTVESAFTSLARGFMPRPLEDGLRRRSGGRLGVRVGPALADIEPIAATADVRGTLLARRLWRALRSDSLPALLRYEDRNSMAFGVEARVPFLDHRLVELACRLPDRLRVERGVTKVILREAMRGRVPDVVRNRRDKLGFVAPQRAWLVADLADARSILSDGQAVARGWVAPREIERLAASLSSDRRAYEQFWRLLVTEAWLRLAWPGRTRDRAGTWDEALAGAEALGAVGGTT